jgi:hypothetical protein
MGHQTEEMRRRYRHLIPNQQQAAIRIVLVRARRGLLDADEGGGVIQEIT